MMQTIALILLGISIIGMAFVLPKTEKEEKRPKKQKIQLREKFDKISLKAPLQFENSLKKFLIRLKIFFLRCENKIDAWLKQISHSKKFNEDYWEKIKRK
ncbi:MAG: hypothetical protein LR000_01435 [Candidatus Pacebacteria bacterium]|nr:hypothetical protein [Candidatus Paceibacterota bacterium]